MAAPPFVPVDPVARPRAYESPDHVPDSWLPDRPAAIAGPQPDGPRLGYQGPDQGYALTLAKRLRPDIRISEGEDVDDALAGCVGLALRRASLFGRAPVIHDLRIALTLWGFLDDAPPAALVLLRRKLFAGLSHLAHHYAEWRELTDSVPDSTLRLSPTDVSRRYPTDWAALLGR
jgi:hypothetical protein